MANTFKFIGPRGCGRTTAIVEACKRIGATMVCSDYQQAKWIEGTHGIKTTDLNANALGTTGPYLFDHHAVDVLSADYEGQIARLREELSAYREELTAARERTERAEAQAVTILGLLVQAEKVLRVEHEGGALCGKIRKILETSNV